MQSKKTYSEEELLKGCAKNSRQHQEYLYRLYFADCYYMCLRYTRDESTAQSIVNDGFLKVFQKIDKYSGSGTLQAWIKRIVFNTMSDHYRKESRYMKMMILEEKDKPTAEMSEDALYYEDIIGLVKNLGATTRDVFQLYAIDGYTHKEIGNLLNISEGNSKWHLHKARKILQEKILSMNKHHRHA